MTDQKFPSVFVSHGAPTIVLEDSPALTFWRNLGKQLGRPRSVLCISAHWGTDAPMVSAAADPETIHDFYGFPEALYQLSYPAPGAPDLARHAAELLSNANLTCGVSPDRGLDHGTWIPLMMMFPDADVPVTQLSIQPALGPGAHLELGRALAPLREEGVLVLASGGAVHNLQSFRPGSTEVSDWAQRFDDWLVSTAEAGDADALVDYRNLSPDGAKAHPQDEHYLPLLVALGAGGEKAGGRVLHRGFMDGDLSMTALAFA
ncbi:MAG: class III extradiol ring-cleavage dioxygenase [Proteobacteria bacterium]|nr:class III extradiol ring-cleavage dioxygenase [Pseudomonadota bacterium]